LSATHLQPDPKFGDCRERCTFAFATAAAFQARAERYSSQIRKLTFFGLALPLSLGSLVAANTFEPSLVPTLVWLAGTLGVIQVVISLWSTVADWPGRLEAAQSSVTANSRLADELDGLAKQAADPSLHFDTEYLKVKTQDDAQRLVDEKQFLSDKEKQSGHRAALYQFQMTCAICGKKPQSKKSPFIVWKRCDSCGGPIK